MSSERLHYHQHAFPHHLNEALHLNWVLGKNKKPTGRQTTLIMEIRKRRGKYNKQGLSQVSPVRRLFSNKRELCFSIVWNMTACYFVHPPASSGESSPDPIPYNWHSSTRLNFPCRPHCLFVFYFYTFRGNNCHIPHSYFAPCIVSVFNFFLIIAAFSRKKIIWTQNQSDKSTSQRFAQFYFIL